MPSNTRSLGAIKAEQNELRARVGRLVDEAREIEVKISVDGADDGLEQRLGTVERGKSKASARLAELGAEHSAAITRMVESGQTHTEAGVNLENAYSTRTDDAPAVEPHRKAALDGALRTLERCCGRATMSDRAAVAVERRRASATRPERLADTSPPWAFPNTTRRSASCSSTATPRRCA